MRTFDNDEYMKIKEELQNFRLPLFARLFKKVWFKVLRYMFLPVFAFLIVMFLFYSSLPFYSPYNDLVWNICKYTIFVFIFGIGGSAVTSNIIEVYCMKKLRRKLNITQQELDYFIVIFDAKGY